MKTQQQQHRKSNVPRIVSSSLVLLMMVFILSCALECQKHTHVLRVYEIIYTYDRNFRSLAPLNRQAMHVVLSSFSKLERYTWPSLQEQSLNVLKRINV